MKHSPDCHASKPYVVLNAEAKLDETATRNPIVTDMTIVAQKTGGMRMRPNGRMNMRQKDSSVYVLPDQKQRPWTYVFLGGIGGRDVSLKVADSGFWTSSARSANGFPARLYAVSGKKKMTTMMRAPTRLQPTQ